MPTKHKFLSLNSLITLSTLSIVQISKDLSACLHSHKPLLNNTRLPELLPRTFIKIVLIYRIFILYSMCESSMTISLRGRSQNISAIQLFGCYFWIEERDEHFCGVAIMDLLGYYYVVY